MTLDVSTMNCSRNVPTRLLGMSIDRSLKLGKPSTCTPSPHIKNWFPTIKEPDTRSATPFWPWARHWSFSTTCTSFWGGQLPASVLRIFDKLVKISFGPTHSCPPKLQMMNGKSFLLYIYRMENLYYFVSSTTFWKFDIFVEQGKKRLSKWYLKTEWSSYKVFMWCQRSSDPSNSK